MFYRYGLYPSFIRATFKNKYAIEIYIGPEFRVFGVIRKRTGNSVINSNDAKQIRIPPVAILPQIRPLLRDEKILTKQHVLRTNSTYLTSQHFRNELKYQNQYFNKFKDLAEQTWHGLKILDLEGKEDSFDSPLGLIIRDENFSAEVGWMGHGLQMWLQVMWFLSRLSCDYSVILDEPDVYMHADLQRKLIQYLRNNYRQTIIATHSVEIMAEVEPENILIVDHHSPQSDFASSLPAVQKIIYNIGGVHNLHLSRLFNSKKCLLLEGDDIEILKYFQNVLFPNTAEPIKATPHIPLGGRGGWSYAIGSSMTLHNSFGDRIRVYCIFDRDYHTDEEITERYLQAREHGIDLHIWAKKELENYLLIPSTIQRAIISKISEEQKIPSIEEITTILESIADSLYDSTFDAISSELLARDRPSGPTSANKNARIKLKAIWINLENKLSVVSGKQVLSKLSEWAQNQYGITLSDRLIAFNLKACEISNEVKCILNSIEFGEPFKTSSSDLLSIVK